MSRTSTMMGGFSRFSATSVAAGATPAVNATNPLAGSLHPMLAALGVTPSAEAASGTLNFNFANMMPGVGGGPGVAAVPNAINTELRQSMLDLMQDAIAGGTPGTGTPVNVPSFVSSMLDIMDDLPGVHLVGLSSMGFCSSLVG